MSKIYTKGGDAGETSLWDGSRVGKNDPHIETNGVLDELNSMVGLAKSFAPLAMKEELDGLQTKLTLLMAYVARGQKPQPTPDPYELEEWIDKLMTEHPLEHSFVNPGATPAGGALHVARAIARRAERAALPLLENGDMEPSAYQYINRLSDLLFALARQAGCDAERRL